MYCYPAKHKSKKDHEEYKSVSMGSTTGSALIAPSISSTSNDSSDDDEYDDCRVLLWRVNPRPPNSKEVKNPGIG